MGGIIDSVFGTAPQQQGTASSPGQDWLSQLLQPMLSQMAQNYQAGQQGYATPEMGSLPEYGQTPQAPYSSPSDMIQSGEMQAAQNIREQFYGGGGGGSAMGGVSGQGQVFDSNLAAQMAQGATGRYAQMQLPYDQMAAQRQGSMFGAGVNQQNMQYQTQAQAMNPMGLLSMYPSTFGSPMVGTEGLADRFGWFGANNFLG